MWFIDSASGPTSPKRDWYVWRDDNPGWTTPWNNNRVWWPGPSGTEFYYALFWRSMPDLNFHTAAVQTELLEAATFWMDAGMSGFRLDAARYLIEDGPAEGQADRPGTHAFLQELRAALADHQPLLVGEVWDETDVIVPYFGTEATPELDMAFDFDGATAILQSIRAENADVLAAVLSSRLAAFPEHSSTGVFLSNHDQTRTASVLDDEASLRLAAALLCALPGTPWIYYGEEIGMRSGTGPSGDRPHRRPMQWRGGAGVGFTTGTAWLEPESEEVADSVAAQLPNPNSLLSYYREQIDQRRAHPALARGSTRVLSDGRSAVLALSRTHPAEDLILLFNLAATATTVDVPDDWRLPNGTITLAGKQMQLHRRQ